MSNDTETPTDLEELLKFVCEGTDTPNTIPFRLIKSVMAVKKGTKPYGQSLTPKEYTDLFKELKEYDEKRLAGYLLFHKVSEDELAEHSNERSRSCSRSLSRSTSRSSHSRSPSPGRRYERSPIRGRSRCRSGGYPPDHHRSDQKIERRSRSPVNSTNKRVDNNLGNPNVPVFDHQHHQQTEHAILSLDMNIISDYLRQATEENARNINMLSKGQPISFIPQHCLELAWSMSIGDGEVMERFYKLLVALEDVGNYTTRHVIPQFSDRKCYQKIVDDFQQKVQYAKNISKVHKYLKDDVDQPLSPEEMDVLKSLPSWGEIVAKVKIATEKAETVSNLEEQANAFRCRLYVVDFVPTKNDFLQHNENKNGDVLVFQSRNEHIQKHCGKGEKKLGEKTTALFKQAHSEIFKRVKDGTTYRWTTAQYNDKFIKDLRNMLNVNAPLSMKILRAIYLRHVQQAGSLKTFTEAGKQARMLGLSLQEQLNLLSAPA